ncbi:alpha/beta hydrolase [Ruixingdingia sedimenti]|uniref:Alpha/beta hydrolase n=1 Tax=Ruixingdingia sedimenti TaxID=3073604 RepID=A0ABU1F8I7_9RHOB|nr:alpha/beta hydrolase [Xinfangfangia sp. LG-4]MDR5653185.1 alpha/beta hydrolase [Xinfangfangia sp. LG-4]
MAAPAHAIRREPVIVEFRETAAFTEVYGFTGSQGSVFLEGQRIIPEGRPSDTVLIFMHPASTLNLMPLPAALAAAGHHVLCCGSRFAKNDSVLVMEKVAADLGAYVRYARETLGYRKVVLAGWSGGGSLALFYQAQAERPGLRDTPAGDPYDLTAMDLQPADAVMFIAAHTGRARILTEWIDPSVIDESDPFARDATLDLYAAGGPKPPYAPEFVARFRQAQRDRMDRITDRVLDRLDMLKRSGTAEVEFPFVVHRTMADPRFLDPALDPNGRAPGMCYLGVPETVNSGPVGLARFCTLRAWLSQWSPRHSRADAEACVRHVAAPLLVIENEADDAVPVDHTHCVFRAAGMRDKTFHGIAGATHYYRGQPAQLAEALGLIGGWLADRNLD